jgi:pantothenate synthetase
MAVEAIIPLAKNSNSSVATISAPAYHGHRRKSVRKAQSGSARITASRMNGPDQFGAPSDVCEYPLHVKQECTANV